MIEVVIQSRDRAKSLEISGHACSGNPGNDLVCSAVSAVVTGAMNAIKEKGNFELKLSPGYAKIKAICVISPHDEVVIEVLITQLKTIVVDNDKFMRIIYK